MKKIINFIPHKINWRTKKVTEYESEVRFIYDNVKNDICYKTIRAIRSSLC